MGGFSSVTMGADAGFLAGSPAPSFSYYVDSVAGLDSNPGTFGAPWQTLAKVNAASLSSGQSVGFKRGGSYAGQLTAAGGVTYGAYGLGANPIINGAGQTQCISATSISNLTLQNLRLTAGGTYGLAANIVTGLVVSGLEIDHAASSGIILGAGTANATISNCLIHDNGGGGTGDRNGIGIGGGGAAPHDIVIQNCDINANYADGIRVSMTSAFNTPFNITIKNNTVRNSVAGNGIAADAAATLSVLYNVVTGNLAASAGIGLYIVPANVSTHIENVQALVYNNTVSGNTWGMLMTLGGGGTANVTAKNNLFSNNGTAGTSAEMGITNLTTWVSDYNLVYHAAGGNFMYAGAFATWATWKTTVTPSDANSINSDPKLNPDYTLQTGSPAIGAGVFISGVSTSNPPNIGAK